LNEKSTSCNIFFTPLSLSVFLSSCFFHHVGNQSIYCKFADYYPPPPFQLTTNNLTWHGGWATREVYGLWDKSFILQHMRRIVNRWRDPCMNVECGRTWKPRHFLSLIIMISSFFKKKTRLSDISVFKDYLEGRKGI
jgi:hypothetical protein